MVDDMDERAYEAALLAAGDEGAQVVAAFEEGILDAVQEEPVLAAAYITYSKARKRLSDKKNSRGFWNVNKG
jgi:hypothetical protein